MCRFLLITVRPTIVGLALLTITMLLAGAGKAAGPGALDLSFGLRGTSVFAMGTSYQESRAIAVQPDGKVILAGFACMGAPCDNNFVVLRFNADGTPDSGFGTNGVVVTDYSGQHEWPQAIAVQADGKIVVAGGTVIGAPTPLGFKIVRYLSDGTLDSSFGTGGKVFEDFNGAGGTSFAVFIQPDGKIVAGGTDGNSMLYIARFNSNGALDTGFGTNGRIATSAFNIYDMRMAPQSDGKILVAASADRVTFTGTLKLIRYNADGTPDNGFGVGGVATTSVFAAAAFVPAVAVLSDGKILVSGADDNEDIRTPPLRRFNTDGSADGSFVANHGETNGPGGFCLSCTQQPAKILQLADGRFYLVGYSRRSSTSPKIFAVTRYLSGGSKDSSFGFRGVSYFRYTNSPPHGNNFPYGVNDAALQADGKVVIAASGNLPIGNTGQLHLIAMRVNGGVTSPSLRGDFDGDGKTDLAVFRPSTQIWYMLNSSDNSVSAARFGAASDAVTPGDYNYDRKTDIAVFRSSQNTWYISPSLPTGGGNPGGAFGQGGDVNVQEDYDGDGKTDLAVFRPSNGTWYIRYSSRILDTNFPTFDDVVPFGLSTDRPVPGDYDGDGRADIAVFRPSTGTWYIFRTSDGIVVDVNFGIGTDRMVQGDYDGDLKTDIAVYRDGAWYVLRSSDNAVVGESWGLSDDKPVPGDYDGDGKFDVAVFRPSTGAWWVLKSSDSSVFGQLWGISEDTPIPFAFVR